MLYRQGRIDEALSELEESLRLDPSQSDLRQDVDRLKEFENSSGPMRKAACSNDAEGPHRAA